MITVRRNIFRDPQTALLANFAALIFIGTFLLMLPISHSSGKVSAIDALFTSTSAVCVTGLITVDTAAVWSVFGKLVIMVLIQFGGLGLMTYGALLFRITGSKLSYASSLSLQSTFFQQNYAAEFRSLFREIILITATIESIGTVVMYFFLPPHETVGRRMLSAIFHTISAFCNAGFSIYSDSLVSYRNNVPLMLLFMFLIVAGGIGYFTLIEIVHRANKKRFKVDKIKWSLNTRVVLLMSAILIVTGFAALFLVGLTPEETSTGQNIMGALFQSVTARTAGFNTVHINALPLAALIIIIMLMFIGGSPGSTAGGVKTTTIAVMLVHIRSGLTKQDDVNLLGRRLPNGVIRRATVLVFLAMMWNMVGVFILSITESTHETMFIDILFEQVSAFATVGLSTGITSSLSFLGKLWIILSMYVGRLGALSVALWFVGEQRTRIRFPKERVMIG